MNTLEIYDLNYRLLGHLRDNTLESARNINTTFKLNQIPSLTFELPLTSRKWKYIVNENLIKYKGEYYFIKNPTLSHTIDKKSMTIDCKHVSSILSRMINVELNIIGESALVMMDKVLKNIKPTEDTSNILDTGWKIGRVEVNPNKYRALQTKEQSVFSNLVAIAEKFDGILRFNSSTKTVDLISKNKLQDRGLYLRTGKNLQSINISYDTSDLVTRLAVFGKQDDITKTEISIMEAKPYKRDERDNFIKDKNGEYVQIDCQYGKSYIENYSYFLNQKYDNGEYKYTKEYIKKHPELFMNEYVYKSKDIINSQALYDSAVRKLEILSKPKIKCTVTGLNLDVVPYQIIENPTLGEIVYIVDEDLDKIVKAQIIGFTENSEDIHKMQIEISNEIEYNNILKSLVDTTDVFKDITSYPDTNDGVMKPQIDMDKAGLKSWDSFWYTDEDGNLIFENKAQTKALKLGEGMFAISNDKDVDNKYIWNTFGDGDGFTADQIVTGMIKGDKGTWNLGSNDYPDGFLLLGNDMDDYNLFFDGANNSLHLKVDSLLIETPKGDYVDIYSEINLTADKIESKIVDVEEKFNSRITQTANSFETSIKDTKNDLESNIRQSANDITIEVKGYTDDGIYDAKRYTDGEVQDVKRETSSMISVQADRIDMISEQININGTYFYPDGTMKTEGLRGGLINFEDGSSIDVRTNCEGGQGLRLRRDDYTYVFVGNDGVDFYINGSAKSGCDSGGLWTLKNGIKCYVNASGAAKVVPVFG